MTILKIEDLQKASVLDGVIMEFVESRIIFYRCFPIKGGLGDFFQIQIAICDRIPKSTNRLIWDNYYIISKDRIRLTGILIETNK